MLSPNTATKFQKASWFQTVFGFKSLVQKWVVALMSQVRKPWTCLFRVKLYLRSLSSVCFLRCVWLVDSVITATSMKTTACALMDGLMASNMTFCSGVGRLEESCYYWIAEKCGIEIPFILRYHLMLEIEKMDANVLQHLIKIKGLSVGYVALSVQYTIVFQIKQTSISNQKQAVCSFLEHFQNYKIGLIFRRLHQKLPSNSNLVEFSETWNARKWERVLKMEFISLFISMYFVSWDFRVWVSMGFCWSHPPCCVLFLPDLCIMCWTPVKISLNI